MCNIDRNAEQALLAMGLNLIGTAMEAYLRENNPPQSSDVLKSAMTAYQQGQITKSQLMGVINALDEAAYQTRAYAEPTNNQWNKKYLEAHNYLNQYRR